jgi:phage shock protein A
MANLIVSALATWNGKALNKGKQDISAFDKTVTKLGRSMAATFSAYQILAFSKKAIKAFAADEKAAKSLALQLENTGNAFAITEVERYIKGLEKTYAILTDLRAPFQTLLNVTGSVTLAQRTLEAALNISAGTGASLNTVIDALSAGIRGQTKGIKSLNTGIDANIIASGDMNKIMAALEKRFAGQAAARLDTYAGKMDVLSKGVDLATKAVGEGLIDALTILGKDNSVAALAQDFQNVGDNIAYAVVQMAKLLDKFSAITGSASFKPALLLLGAAASAATGNPLPFVAAFGAVGAMGIGGALSTPRKISSEENSALARIRLLNARIDAKLAGAKKKEYDLLTAKNAIENKNVEELKKKFDLERIGLTAALNNATDEETKLRLRAQLAILDNNEALAKKLIAEMEATEALKKLAEQARLAGMSLEDFALFKVKALNTKIDDYLQKTALEMVRALNAQIAALIASLGGIKSTKGGGGDDGGGTIALTGAEYFQDLATKLVGTTGYSGMNVSEIATERARESGNRSVDVNVRIDSPSGDKFAQLVAESIQVAGRSGFNTAPAGSLS